MSISANTAATIATTAANNALQAAQAAQVAASQADIAARRGSNVTNLTVINPPAAGITGAVQFSSGSNQLSGSRNFVFDQFASNLQIVGNLNVQNLIQTNNVNSKSISVLGTITSETIIAAKVESLANIRVANRVDANVVFANAFYGNGSQLTGLLSPNNPTLTGNVSVPLITLDASTNAPVPLGLLKDVLPTKANINSPNFTGIPTAPTITNVATSDNSIATTAFVQLAMNTKANTSNVTLTNVNLLGNITAPTQTPTANNNLLATTQFVQNQKISPIFSGIPIVPTPNGAVNSQIATVGFVRTSSAPNIIISRRTANSLIVPQNMFTNIPFDTFDRNTAGAVFDGTNFDLLSGTYVYSVFISAQLSLTSSSVKLRFLNLDTSFVIQNISSITSNIGSLSLSGSGQFSLSGTTTVGLQIFTGLGSQVTIAGDSGFQTGLIQFWKVA